MVDFFEKGYAIVELFDPKLALEVWKDMDKDEIERHRDEAKSDKPKKPLTVPKTASFSRFVQEIDNVRETGQIPSGAFLSKLVASRT